MAHKAYGLNELREMYLRFFESKGHLRLPSFSLVPQNDKSILLINAGMTPMKPFPPNTSCLATRFLRRTTPALTVTNSTTGCFCVSTAI